jgi:hypothetical protein
METLETATPFQRYVVLAVFAHEEREETPAQTFDVRDFCVEHRTSLEGNPFEGGVSRESIIRALSSLEEEGVLESEVVDASPVGKGRPAYRLAVDTETVEESLLDDDLFAPLVRSLSD